MFVFYFQVWDTYAVKSITINRTLQHTGKQAICLQKGIGFNQSGNKVNAAVWGKQRVPTWRNTVQTTYKLKRKQPGHSDNLLTHIVLQRCTYAFDSTVFCCCEHVRYISHIYLYLHLRTGVLLYLHLLYISVVPLVFQWDRVSVLLHCCCFFLSRECKLWCMCAHL